jgi:hypothetical protein
MDEWISQVSEALLYHHTKRSIQVYRKKFDEACLEITARQELYFDTEEDGIRIRSGCSAKGIGI